MRITACGCVGINCTGPGRTLAVGGDAEINTNLIVNTALYTKDWYGIGSNAQRLLNSSGTELVRVTCDGNVGIGTTAPSNLLTIDGKGVNAVGLTVKNDSYTGSFIPTSLGGMAISTPHPFLFYINSAERMRINTAGCVGINEDSIDAYLHLSNSGVINQKFERPGAAA